MDFLISKINVFSEMFIDAAWVILWQSSLLIILISLAGLILRKASPNFRYFLWLLVALRLLIPPGITLPSSIAAWGPAVFNNKEIFTTPELYHRADISGGEAAILSGDKKYESIGAAGIEPALPGAAALSESLSYKSALVLCWSAVVSLLLIYLLTRIVRLRAAIKKSEKPSGEVVEIIGEYAKKLGIQTRLSVMVSDVIPSPIVAGFLSPAIILPSAIIKDMNNGELTAVIVHELAHIKRRDWLVNWGQIFLGVIYFFHPLLWFVNRQIRIEREKACDDIVLLTLNIERSEYAGSLIKALDNMSKSFSFQAGFVGMAEPKSAIGKRIIRIMDKSVIPMRRLSFLSAVIIILFGLCFLTVSSEPDSKDPAKSDKVKSSRNTDDKESGKAKAVDSVNITKAANPPLQVAASNPGYADFEVFYNSLNADLRLKLDRTISVNLQSSRLRDILAQVVYKAGLTLNFESSTLSPEVSKAFETVYNAGHKDTAADILRLYSNLEGLVWKEEKGQLFVAKDMDSTSAEFNFFIASLSSELKAKLDKNITLIFKNTKIDQVFFSISKQSDVVFIRSGQSSSSPDNSGKTEKDSPGDDSTDLRINVIYQNITALEILKGLARTYNLKYEYFPQSNMCTYTMQTLSSDKTPQDGTSESDSARIIERRAKLEAHKARIEELVNQRREQKKAEMEKAKQQDKGKIYKIRISSSKDKDSATHERNALVKDGYYPINVEKAGDEYVVYMGEFSNSKEAEECLERLKSSGVNCDRIETFPTQPAENQSGDIEMNKIKKAQNGFRVLAVSLEAYAVDYKRYPQSDNFSALTTPIMYLSPQAIDLVKDPFSDGKLLRFKPDEDKKGWRIWSVGPDGKDGGGDKEFDPLNENDKSGDLIRSYRFSSETRF